ncbi:MAG: tRNA 2-selenouridine synthase [Planctomycetota bacterium]|jgi:tRNA 2-selenouridine synthase
MNVFEFSGEEHATELPSSVSRTAIPMTSVEAVLESGALVIDLRSPSEFALDHLPNAISIPLFGDDERALVGTLYKQQSPEEAFSEAREIARGRIRSMVLEISESSNWQPPDDDFESRLTKMTEGGVILLEGELFGESLDSITKDHVVLHCWRGGLRSRSVVAFLNALGLDKAVLLEGGYKQYRRVVLSQLKQATFPRAFVLRGLTGVGKSLVLRELEQLRPGWAIDLELLAGHRSSILGMVGLEPCNQKTFDSRLASQLRIGLSEVVVYEGESRKVGDTILPASLWASLSSGTDIEVTAPIDYRVDVLIDDYLDAPENRTELRKQLPFIENRLGKNKWTGVLVDLLDNGGERELVELLLEHYYDPLYSHSHKQHTFGQSIDSTDPRRAAESIIEWIESELGRSAP